MTIIDNFNFVQTDVECPEKHTSKDVCKPTIYGFYSTI